MKKLAFAVVLLLLAGSLTAATLVLKGGKHLDVKSFVQQGNLMLVTLADGRVQSYPLAAIDVGATTEANPPAPAPPTENRPAGPRSPFAAARSAPAGEGTLVVTDADVAHAMAAEAEEAAEGGQEEEKIEAGPARVEIVSYQKTPVGNGDWELGVVVSNLGGSDASGVTVTAQPTDAAGNSLGSGSGSLSGKLEPGKQATVTIKMSAAPAATGFRFDVSYQTITKVPSTPAPSAGESGGGATPAASPTPRVTRVQAPPNTLGAPNTMSANPNAQLPLTAPPTAPPETR